MWNDPVVEEVRKAGAKLAEEADNDAIRFAEMLRANQYLSGHKVVSFDIGKVPVKYVTSIGEDMENGRRGIVA